MLHGEITIPADKSISHRALILGALTKGEMKISNFLNSADCMHTLEILRNLGCKIEFLDDYTLILNSKNAFSACPLKPLNCGNSGTSMRILAGILASLPFETVLIGDKSLSSRPMKRIIEPLTKMGAKITSNNNCAPLKIVGSNLCAIDYASKIASAQVKSCILLAGLFAKGKTTFIEPYKSRNHTELMLSYLGANIEVSGNCVSIEKSNLVARDIEIAGDISSAAFFIVAALIVKGSDILIKNVGVNETRTGILDVLTSAGAKIEILNERTISNEKVADIHVQYSDNMRPIKVCADMIPRMIDEIPILALLATQIEGTSVISDAQDLRNKESDRISNVVHALNLLGADVKETADGFIIKGKTQLQGGVKLNSNMDHRLFMTYFVASLICADKVEIEGSTWVSTSFPTFFKLMSDLGVKND